MSFIKLNVTDKKCSTIYMSNEEPKLLKSKKKTVKVYQNVTDVTTTPIVEIIIQSQYKKNVTNGTTVKSC